MDHAGVVGCENVVRLGTNLRSGPFGGNSGLDSAGEEYHFTPCGY